MSFMKRALPTQPLVSPSTSSNSNISPSSSNTITPSSSNTTTVPSVEKLSLKSSAEAPPIQDYDQSQYSVSKIEFCIN